MEKLADLVRNARTLSDTGNHTAATAAAAEAMALYPDTPRAFHAAAKIAETANDMPVALRLYKTLRTRFPFADAGYTGAARLFSRQNDTAGARRLRAEVEHQLPAGHEATQAEAARWPRTDFAGITLVDAALAVACVPLRPHHHQPAFWDEAFRRATAVRDLFIGEIDAWATLVDRLRLASRHAQAIEVAAQAANRFGDQPSLLKPAALSAFAQGDAPATEALLNRLAAVGAEDAAMLAMRARLMAQSGQHRNATDLLRTALAADPTAAPLWHEYARQARAVHDWNTAVERLRAAHEARPNDRRIAASLRAAELQATMAPRIAPGPTPLAALAALVKHFESLGGHRNYGRELGMVQRRFGYESDGLLRWSTIRLPMLIRALQEDFAGVGNPAQTDVHVLEKSYHVRDRRYTIDMNTHIYLGSIPHQNITAEACNQLTALLAKFRADLAAANKIFTYKMDMPCDPAELDALHAAFRIRSPAPLLVVQTATGTDAPGSVRQVSPGFYLGFVASFIDPKAKIAIDPKARISVVDYASWQSICEGTKRMCGAPQEGSSSFL